MQNSYLGLNPDSVTGKFHPVLAGLEDATRIINGVWRLDVEPRIEFPSPVTLIPSYPDLPMEDVFPRVPAHPNPRTVLAGTRQEPHRLFSLGHRPDILGGSRC